MFSCIISQKHLFRIDGVKGNVIFANVPGSKGHIMQSLTVKDVMSTLAWVTIEGAFGM